MIESIEQLASYIDLTVDEARDIDRVGERYPWRVSGHFASLMDHNDRSCPIRLQAVPDARELDDGFGAPDPLSESGNSPVPGVIHVYPDRIAVIATERCPMYCRHCLRKRYRRDAGNDLAGARLEAVLDYIRRDGAIRDVLVTGGDPLMLSDAGIDEIMSRIRSIPHVEIIRIGTRAPVTWPERITDSLAGMLRRHDPVWICTQFNHPREIAPASRRAIAKLVDGGIPVNNQSVLLRGVNDDVGVMRTLAAELVKLRVRPYYLYQAQVLSGTGHFVVPVERGLEIIRGLRGWTTGFSVPQYVLDTPMGKVPLNPEYLVGRDGDYVEMVGYDGRSWREYNPRNRDRVGTLE